MIDGGRIQWLLGLGILVVGAFMLFGQADEAPSQDQAPFSIAPEDIPPPPAGLPIKLVDAKTKACMADMACMQEFFLKVTLGNEYEPRNTSDPRISKWRTPSRFRFYGQDDMDQQHLDALYRGAANIVKIAETAGIDLKQDRRNINVIVILSSDLREDFEGKLSKVITNISRKYPVYVDRILNLESLSNLCSASTSASSGSEIGDSLILIGDELDPETIESCIYEEFSQMLGLYADVADDIDSLYTDQEHRRQLTEFDFLLLRLLYHPLIEPGMNRDEVIVVFPEVYRQTVGTSALLGNRA